MADLIPLHLTNDVNKCKRKRAGSCVEYKTKSPPFFITNNRNDHPAKKKSRIPIVEMSSKRRTVSYSCYCERTLSSMAK
ncbi:unnamed protein product [Phytomonas sp. Hart1]|nr:unnamed protein product [Phytomonas sp. Hart1]|eukprot:CCW67561.1 unnamed protein product [Phytomonas sp. isolate Hart1]